jgi:hypothetical protein
VSWEIISTLRRHIFIRNGREQNHVISLKIGAISRENDKHVKKKVSVTTLKTVRQFYMGGASSVALRQDRQYYSLEDLQQIFGPFFDTKVFDELKNDEGFVSHLDAQQHLSNRLQEQHELTLVEIRRLFKIYCPTGDLSNKALLNMLRDARLLKKKGFTARDSDLLFERAKSQQEIMCKTFNYIQFIQDIIPMIAEKANLSRDRVLHQLACIDHESLDDEVPQLTLPQPKAANSDEREKAAIRLQSMTRQKSASARVAALKNVCRRCICRYSNLCHRYTTVKLIWIRLT